MTGHLYIPQGVSPLKKRDPRKTHTFHVPTSLGYRRAAALKNLQRVLEASLPNESVDISFSEKIPGEASDAIEPDQDEANLISEDMAVDTENEEHAKNVQGTWTSAYWDDMGGIEELDSSLWGDERMLTTNGIATPDVFSPSKSIKDVSKQRERSQKKAGNLIQRFKELVEDIVPAYATFWKTAVHHPIAHLPPNTTFSYRCGQCTELTLETSEVTCLLFECESTVRHRNTLTKTHLDYQAIRVTTCGCRSIPLILVDNGFFPTSPVHPKTAFSIDLLHYFRVSFGWGTESVYALARTVYNFHETRGYLMLNQNVRTTRDVPPSSHPSYLG